jgi:hypothetical protein
MSQASRISIRPLWICSAGGGDSDAAMGHLPLYFNDSFSANPFQRLDRSLNAQQQPV